MPFDVLAHFVDRERERGHFHHMLAGETGKRVLLITAEGEQGKTCLLLRLFFDCEDRDIPTVLLDFDQRKSGLTDYLSVAREIRRHLGDEHTSAICACEDEITRPRPVVNIQTGGGKAAGVDFGRRDDFTGATLRDIASRDLIQVSNVSGATPTADLIARQRDDMGRALGRDLAGLAPARVALLLDTFEHASPETCEWLERWLFQPLRHLSHVLLVVAGRPECRSFFDQPRLWGDLVIHFDRFDPFSRDEALTYYRRRNLPVDETDTLFLQVACSKAGLMAQLGDAIRQERRGMR